MTEAASVSAGPDGRVLVAGLLDVHTVADCRDEGLPFFEDAGDPLVFDLSESDPRGSAAIALLIAWQREAKRRDARISIVGASERLLEIADACGVREFLPFDESAAPA